MGFAFAGVALLVVLMFDIFITVFHSQGRAGPITQTQNRIIWRLFRSGGRRPGLLSLAAPIMVVLMLLVWTALLVAGYALIYYPWIEDFLVSTGALRTPWLESLYFSGYTAATLGLGDLLPDHETLRILTIVQAFSGFALISVSITYLLATYREIISLRALALDIGGYFRANEIGSDEFIAMDGYEAMTRWSESVASRLLVAFQALFQYPVLRYFRPRDETRALPVQLSHVLRFRHDPGSERGRRFVRHHPSFISLFSVVDEYLDEVSRFFVPDREAWTTRDAGRRDEAALERLLRYMGYEPRPGRPS